MEQTPRGSNVDEEESRPQATRSAPPIPIWLIFFLAAIAALALIYLMGLLAPTA